MITTPLQLRSYTTRGNAQALAPGFPRLWPECEAAMRAIASHLWSLGATQEEILVALRRDFPDLPDACYQNPLAIEVMRLIRHPHLRQRLDPQEQDDLDPGRLQAAELVLEELHAQGAYALRKGDTVDVRRLDPATTHRLTDELKAAVGDYAEEIFALVKDAQPRARRTPAVMPPAVLSFAGAQGCVCAYCEREGDGRGDPDGAAWHKDHVPSLRTANPFVLACSACRERPDRARLLEGKHERY